MRVVASVDEVICHDVLRTRFPRHGSSHWKLHMDNLWNNMDTLLDMQIRFYCVPSLGRRTYSAATTKTCRIGYILGQLQSLKSATFCFSSNCECENRTARMINDGHNQHNSMLAWVGYANSLSLYLDWGLHCDADIAAIATGDLFQVKSCIHGCAGFMYVHCCAL